VGLADEFARATAGGGCELLMGTVVTVDTATGALVVNIGGNTHAAALIADGGFAPYPGAGCAVLRQGQVLVVIGLLHRYLPPYGTVAATGAQTLTVTVPGVGNLALPYLGSYASPTVGDLVSIMWGGSASTGVVVGELSTSPTSPTKPPPAPPPPPPPPITGVTTFPALSVGTYRSGWRTDDNGDVIQGTAPGYSGINEGAWFYHGTVHATLSGATVTAAEIYLGRTSGGTYAAQNCHLYRVANDTRPAGALSFGSGPFDAPVAVGQEGWFTFSTSIAQELVTSGGSVGIKAPSGPYMRMYGLSKSGSAGALRITWSR
jgi:hypothetical protein